MSVSYVLCQDQVPKHLVPRCSGGKKVYILYYRCKHEHCVFKGSLWNVQTIWQNTMKTPPKFFLICVTNENTIEFLIFIQYEFLVCQNFIQAKDCCGSDSLQISLHSVQNYSTALVILVEYSQCHQTSHQSPLWLHSNSGDILQTGCHICNCEPRSADWSIVKKNLSMCLE